MQIYEIIGDGYLKVKSGLAVQDPESIKTLLKGDRLTVNSSSLRNILKPDRIQIQLLLVCYIFLTMWKLVHIDF